jgi:hypothetical protein
MMAGGPSGQLAVSSMQQPSSRTDIMKQTSLPDAVELGML